MNEPIIVLILETECEEWLTGLIVEHLELVLVEFIGSGFNFSRIGA
jgi:hypothetical protein